MIDLDVINDSIETYRSELPDADLWEMRIRISDVAALVRVAEAAQALADKRCSGCSGSLVQSCICDTQMCVHPTICGQPCKRCDSTGSAYPALAAALEPFRKSNDT